jgi:MFS family permease
MLSSINPLGERGRNQHYAMTVIAYITASAAAGAVLGALLGGVVAAVAPQFTGSRLAAGIVAALALAGIAFDTGAVRRRIPGPRRQVNEDWLATYRGWVYGAGFGAQLGAGFVTIVVASTTWIAFMCAALSGSAVAGAVIGFTFGAVRAATILRGARARDVPALHALFRQLDRSRARAQRVTVFGQLGVGIALLVALVGSVR